MSRVGEQLLETFRAEAPWVHVGDGKFMQLMQSTVTYPALNCIALDEDPLVEYDNAWAE